MDKKKFNFLYKHYLADTDSKEVAKRLKMARSRVFFVFAVLSLAGYDLAYALIIERKYNNYTPCELAHIINHIERKLITFNTAFVRYKIDYNRLADSMRYRRDLGRELTPDDMEDFLYNTHEMIKLRRGYEKVLHGEALRLETIKRDRVELARQGKRVVKEGEVVFGKSRANIRPYRKAKEKQEAHERLMEKRRKLPFFLEPPPDYFTAPAPKKVLMSDYYVYKPCFSKIYPAQAALDENDKYIESTPSRRRYDPFSEKFSLLPKEMKHKSRVLYRQKRELVRHFLKRCRYKVPADQLARYKIALLFMNMRKFKGVSRSLILNACGIPTGDEKRVLNRLLNEDKYALVRPIMYEIHHRYRGRIGRIKMTLELRRHNIFLGEHTVRRLAQETGLTHVGYLKNDEQ